VVRFDIPFWHLLEVDEEKREQFQHGKQSSGRNLKPEFHSYEVEVGLAEKESHS
jgi:hypothetical protein